MEDRSIQCISSSSIHKICSGQVVLSLATAVKELVENSLDAGATVIEVKLKDYGSEMIEVIDNGKGVKSSDFQSITLKHHTSKLSDFSDVQNVSTFGFRGEALSSLCALSDVEILTCHSEKDVGSRIVYDHDGSILETTPLHRQVGTTVIVKNLFYTLPVRHKEFQRHIRKEYAKMLQILMAYCLISLKTKIICTSVAKNGKRTNVFSSNSCESYKDNILCIFGKKQVDHLVELVQIAPSLSDLEEYFLPEASLAKCDMFQIGGYVSSSCHGEGQNSPERQFVFIDGRPCDFPKVLKLINDVYHSFNKHQHPFVFLRIHVSEGSADVNVVPDKRKIFISEEKLLLCIIKTSLLHLYKYQPSELKMVQPNLYFHQFSTASKPSSINGDIQISTNPTNASDEILDQRLPQERDSKAKDVLLMAKLPLSTKRKPTSESCLGRRKCPKRETDIPASTVEACSREVFVAQFKQRKKRVRIVVFNLQGLKKGPGQKIESKAGNSCSYRKFRSKILPADNSSAEEELKKEIKKEDFAEMDIIGQFNLGFIIARLKDDLFIIDQHATDEKYNYEFLQRNTVLKTQKLLSSQKLDLSPANESLLMDNLHIFEKSGFAFDTNKDGARVQLVSVPVDHAWNFGKADIDEMLFMLTNNPVCVIRPSRINQMFASRACRMSVMIGTALPLQAMKKLILQMSEMEQPWNCPHGRPTIRHLFNLTLLVKV